MCMCFICMHEYACVLKVCVCLHCVTSFNIMLKLYNPFLGVALCRKNTAEALVTKICITFEGYSYY